MAESIRDGEGVFGCMTLLYIMDEFVCCLFITGTIKEGSIQDQALPQSDEHGKFVISVIMSYTEVRGMIEGTHSTQCLPLHTVRKAPIFLYGKCSKLYCNSLHSYRC